MRTSVTQPEPSSPWFCVEELDHLPGLSCFAAASTARSAWVESSPRRSMPRKSTFTVPSRTYSSTTRGNSVTVYCTADRALEVLVLEQRHLCAGVAEHRALLREAVDERCVGDHVARRRLVVAAAQGEAPDDQCDRHRGGGADRDHERAIEAAAALLAVWPRHGRHRQSLPARAERALERPRAYRQASAASAATVRARAGANLNAWPEHAEATTTRPCRSRTKLSSAVFV